MKTNTAPALDPKAFRAALGSFATGVTVITTRAADGSPVGLTANSFNSVSLDPPMVLWSLAKKSHSLAAFSRCSHWAVHVLAADQEELSGRFARSGTDKFSGLEVGSGIGGVPLLAGCAARFQCQSTFQHEGGDHLIFVGEVTAFDRTERAPLVFHVAATLWRPSATPACRRPAVRAWLVAWMRTCWATCWAGPISSSTRACARRRARPD